MAVERTLSIIKPDAVAKNVIGEIYARFEKAGLKIIAARMAWLSRAEAEGFYAVHRERPFFRDLVDFMISGPVMIQVLEGDGAISEPRADGRDGSQEGRTGNDPGRFRAIDRRQRRARLRRPRDRARSRSLISFPRWRIFTSVARKFAGRPDRMLMINLLDLDRRDELVAFFAERGEKPFRARAGVQLGAPAIRRRHRRDDRSREATARALAGGGECRGPPVVRATRRPPTARASGCSTPATATPSSRCTSPRTTAARFASPRRPVVRSTAHSARPASRASTAT